MGYTVKASADKSLNAFGTADCPHFIRFKKFCDMLSTLYGVGLHCPELVGTGEDRLSSLKAFLSGLIERRRHPWRVPLKAIGIRSRMSVAHSLFLFRKTLPSKEPDLKKFLETISKPCPDVEQDFEDFSRGLIAKIFPVGWDTMYPNRCISTTISTSSCVESGVSKGGCRSWVLDNQMPDISCREDFVETCLVLGKYQRPQPSRLVAVETGGKWRKITVPSANMSVLRPLHQSIYDQLSKQSWLLRGKESAKSFSDFTSVPGELFVSGDYESATDFLNNKFSKFVLAQILMRSRSVPHGISMTAMDSLSLPVSLRSGEETLYGYQSSGQMMGYLLSFPLLCLVNYLTFKYSVRRDVPVKINGDDIVFRSTPEEKDVWFRNVSKSGLIVSRGKTLVDKRFFTLNSCLFEGTKKVSMLPFVRSAALFPKSRDPEAVMGLRGRYNSFCPGFCGEKRAFLRESFLRFNRTLIDVTRRSVSRGLGLSVTFPNLVNSGLWAREAWHLSLEREKPIPAPFSEWSCRPKGYKYIRCEQITKEIKKASEGLSAAWLDAAWEKPSGVKVQDWFAEMKENTYDWGFWSESRSINALKRARLLGLSVRNAQRFLRPKRSLFSDSFKKIKCSAWVKEDFTPSFQFLSKESRFDVEINWDGQRTERTDDNIDFRDYYEPTVSTESLFVGGGRIQGFGSLSRGGLGFELGGGGSHSVRIFSSGLGFAPPPCLL